MHVSEVESRFLKELSAFFGGGCCFDGGGYTLYKKSQKDAFLGYLNGLIPTAL